MNQALSVSLPPNPYRRSPIKKIENLAGRATERNQLRYYFRLTAAGDSPHLALVGQRGVGKTSLLNAAEIICRELKLLPIRIDLNELKAKSPGRFWRDLYQTITLEMAKLDCWGGEHGPIYSELLRMMHSRQPGEIDKAVIQVPYVFSCYQGNIDFFECPDALVINDLNVCLKELRSKTLSGMVFLMDEADCLGQNVPLLQMLRNIFQSVNGCSLVLAGTDAVFPALSEVFSPIPRQFHRVDVRPFARWSDTLELIWKAIPEDLVEAIGPKRAAVRELHELCGGSPDEIQLYCHHMYRKVEDGSSSKMSLSPEVFRDVLREYRSHAPANLDEVLNSIERLPDRLLFKSRWVSRRQLNAEQNSQISILRREIQTGKLLDQGKKDSIVSEIRAGYRQLFDSGIIESEERIQLIGAPLTAGFWKSFVEVERGSRFSWQDRSFADLLQQPIVQAMGQACGAMAGTAVSAEDSARHVLESLRRGERLQNSTEGVMSIVFACIIGREEKTTKVVDVQMQLELPIGRHSTQIRFIEGPDGAGERKSFEAWLGESTEILESNGISCKIGAVTRWDLPTSEELHRLSWIASVPLPSEFGPSLSRQAVDSFTKGDVHGAIKLFTGMLADREDSEARNNLAFCQIVVGEFQQGLENAERACGVESEPLWEINRGLALHLTGNVASVERVLRDALARQRRTPDKFPDGVFALVLDKDNRGAKAVASLSTEAAILINLARIGVLVGDELESKLNKLSVEDHRAVHENM